MCGRYTLHSPRDLVSRRFRVDVAEVDVQPRYNIAPTQDVLVVALGKEGERKAVPMRWGFIPFWSPEPNTKLSTINAKVETAPESRLYRDAFRKRRCLILADGFYEWQPPAPGKKGAKVPHWIARQDRAPFAFAGLYSAWRPKDHPTAPPLLSCTILTTSANPIVAPIHARMPLILRPEHESVWLDPNLQEPEAQVALLNADAELLYAHPVSTRVNSPHNDGADLLAEAAQGDHRI